MCKRRVYCKCENHHHDPSTIKHQSTSAAISGSGNSSFNWKWDASDLASNVSTSLPNQTDTHPHQCPMTEGPTRRIEGQGNYAEDWPQKGEWKNWACWKIIQIYTYSQILKHQKDTFLETRKSIWPSISWPSKLPSLFWCLHQTSWTLWFLPAGQIRWMRSQNHGPPAVFLHALTYIKETYKKHT